MGLWKCPVCGEDNLDKRDECFVCAKKGIVTKRPSLDVDEDPSKEVLELAAKMTLTTAPFLDGYRVKETIDIITAECVFGMNLFRDFFTGATDFFGGRSGATQKVLRQARQTCLAELKKEAAQVGANTVIAVDLNYSEFSGKGKSMLFLVATGTAVNVEPLD